MIQGLQCPQCYKVHLNQIGEDRCSCKCHSLQEEKQTAPIVESGPLSKPLLARTASIPQQEEKSADWEKEFEEQFNISPNKENLPTPFTVRELKAFIRTQKEQSRQEGLRELQKLLTELPSWKVETAGGERSVILKDDIFSMAYPRTTQV